MTKILAIDDNKDNLVSLVALLRNLVPGCELLSALSGLEGIAIAKDESPDVILLDINMPGMDGYEVCRKIKNSNETRHIPIIMLTAVYIDIKSRVKGLEIGADAFLAKPIDEIELVAQVKVMLRIKKTEDILRDEKDLLKTDLELSIRELGMSHNEIRNLSIHLESIREDERTGIARELHDELGQSLTALKLDLLWMKKRMSADQKDLIQKTNSMLEIIHDTIGTVRKISSELRPGILDDLGLYAAIEWQANEIKKRSGINYVVNCNNHTIHNLENILVENQYTIQVFRIFQEAMTNIVRHSSATKVEVTLQDKDGEFEMSISDNGIGIVPDKLQNSSSFGLLGMRERAYSCGGELNITKNNNGGTTVKLTI